jgi:glycosyltransferase involved in cell wall biosynthesis
VLLLHQSRGDEGEARVASAAAAVVTTSAWTRGLVTAQDQRPAAGVHVAVPGADPAPCAAGTARGDRLLCVGTVTAAKGHGDLADALARLGSRAWTCVCPGSLARDPLFAAELRCRLAADGLLGRVRLPGPWVGAALDRAYAAADLLVLPSRAESYGMVVTEALARGLPVVATDAGGVPEALGGGPGLPGMLVPVGDPVALADALARWLDDPALRGRLRANAVARRSRLAGWEATTEKVAHVLAGVAQDVAA